MNENNINCKQELSNCINNHWAKLIGNEAAIERIFQNPSGQIDIGRYIYGDSHCNEEVLKKPGGSCKDFEDQYNKEKRDVDTHHANELVSKLGDGIKKSAAQQQIKDRMSKSFEDYEDFSSKKNLFFKTLEGYESVKNEKNLFFNNTDNIFKYIRVKDSVNDKIENDTRCEKEISNCISKYTVKLAGSKAAIEQSLEHPNDPIDIGRCLYQDNQFCYEGVFKPGGSCKDFKDKYNIEKQKVEISFAKDLVKMLGDEIKKSTVQEGIKGKISDGFHKIMQKEIENLEKEKASLIDDTENTKNHFLASTENILKHIRAGDSTHSTDLHSHSNDGVQHVMYEYAL